MTDTASTRQRFANLNPQRASSNHSLSQDPIDEKMNDSRSNPQTEMEVTENGQASSSSSSSSSLSEVETAVLRQLRPEEMFQVIGQLKTGVSLTEALESAASDTIQRVRETLKEQYATLGQPVQDDIINASIDEVVDSMVGPGVTCKLTLEDIERLARVTPLRLSYDERIFLRLLESTLEVSEYTDKVDVLDRRPPAKRMTHEIKQICAILLGLAVAHQYDVGQRLIKERDYKENQEFFRNVFEIGRRYKILNPERMRDSYGKLIYFLMDSRRLDVVEQLEFDCVAEVKTVATLLANKKNGRELLSDPLLRLATSEIHPEGKPRSQVQWEIKKKEEAIKTLAEKYSTIGSYARGTLFSRITNSILGRRGDESDEEEEEDLSPEEIEQCLYSLCDHHTFLRFNREPVDRMIKYLKSFFEPNRIDHGFSLAINCGRQGSRLTHSHERQYTYVLQSLMLWREVLNEMLGLWGLAEQDLLNSSNPYRLRDTGQGLNRVQSAPLVYRSMARILERVQKRVGGWCGSSTIHLGDHNVPNALTFIDKYIQVPRILGPITLTLGRIPELYTASAGLKLYIDKTFGGPELLVKLILVDFFRHAFDGSGADNFYDAGSCIDGRLTSAWNWCSKIHEKPYYHVFLLSGFSGFDGRF